MSSLETFRIEYKKYKFRANLELIVFCVLFIIGFIWFEPLIMLLTGDILYEIFGEVTSIVAFGLYPVFFIIWCIIVSTLGKRNRLSFINRVYPGLREIKHKEFKRLNNLKAKDRVGNIINEKLVIKTVNDKKKIFNDSKNGIMYGLGCLVGKFKLQVYEGKFYKQERNEIDTIFQGLVVMITAPNQYNGSELIQLLDEYALRKQNGKLKLYKDNMFYINTYKSDDKFILNLEGLSIIGSDKEKCWEGCLLINELVALLRTIDYDEVII